jgi:hypothetical protein|tara:strand:+ start:70 stop:2007 length:1938 start_codon:yes stop_codon:yes gene_type:complete
LEEKEEEEMMPITGLSLRTIPEDGTEAEYERVLPGKTFDDGKELVVERGNGCPIAQLNVFRSPDVRPRHGHSEYIDLVTPSHSGQLQRFNGTWLGRDRSSRNKTMVTDGGPITDHHGALQMKTVVTANGDQKYDDIGVVRGAIKNVYGHVVGVIKGFVSMNTERTMVGYCRIDREKTTYGLMLEGEVVGSTASQGGLSSCVALDNFNVTGTFPNTSTSTSNSTTSGVYMQAQQVVKVNADVPSEQPIMDITILRDGEAVPDGWEKIPSTLNDVSADLNKGCKGSACKNMYLAIRRGNAKIHSGSNTDSSEQKNDQLLVDNEEKRPITDVSVMWGFEGISGGWECVERCPHDTSQNANLNHGVEGSTELFLCVKRAQHANVPRFLMDVGTVQVGGGVNTSKIPSEWSRVNNSCGTVSMEANLNSGNGNGAKLFLCKLIGKQNPSPIEAPFFNGTYTTNGHDGTLSLSLIGWTRGRYIQGSFYEGNQTLTYKEGLMQGIIASTNEEEMKNTPPSQLNDGNSLDSVGPWQTLGLWRNGGNSDWNSVEFNHDSELGTSDGLWTKLKMNPKNMVQGKWNIVKDDFVQVSYRKDYTTLYQHGVLEFGTRTMRHDVNSMLESFFSSAVLGGDNKGKSCCCQKKRMVVCDFVG